MSTETYNMRSFQLSSTLIYDKSFYECDYGGDLDTVWSIQPPTDLTKHMYNYLRHCDMVFK